MDIHELVGAYSVDALDPDERHAFEAHLPTCARCREELRAYAGMLDALTEPGDDASAGSAADVPVPAGLAERIGAEVARTPQERASAPGAAAGSDVASLDAARTRRRPIAQVLALAAALVLVAAVGVGALLQLRGGDVLSDFERIRVAADREDLPLELGDATVWVSRAVGGEEADGVAVDGTLPGVDQDQTYQVWVVPADGSAPVPGPVLRPTPDGVYAASWVTSLDGAAAIAISVEPWDPAAPDQGSSTPTTVVAAVEL